MLLEIVSFLPDFFPALPELLARNFRPVCPKFCPKFCPLQCAKTLSKIKCFSISGKKCVPETIEQWSKNNFGQAGLANGFGSLNLRSRLNFGLGFNLRVCVLANRLGADVFHFRPNAFRRVVVFSRNQRCPRKQKGPTHGQHTRSTRTPHQRGNNAVGKATLACNK